VAGSSKEADFLNRYGVVPAMRRLDSVHARLTQSNTKMLLFDIRHPSRDAIGENADFTISEAKRGFIRQQSIKHFLYFCLKRRAHNAACGFSFAFQPSLQIITPIPDCRAEFEELRFL
jgi:hypothetical protein